MAKNITWLILLNFKVQSQGYIEIMVWINTNLNNFDNLIENKKYNIKMNKKKK